MHVLDLPFEIIIDIFYFALPEDIEFFKPVYDREDEEDEDRDAMDGRRMTLGSRGGSGGGGFGGGDASARTMGMSASTEAKS